MDINQILEQLRAEREQIEAAILALERLVHGGGKRRGRPPKWMQPVDGGDQAPDGEHHKPRKFSEEARKRMSEAQRKRWAAKHVKPS